MEHFITHAVEQYGYLAIFLLMLLDAACIPIPSEVTMLFGGAFATTAVGGDAHLNFWLVCLAGTAGNLVGLVARLRGRPGRGRPLAERWGRWVLINRTTSTAPRLVRKHGEAAVFFCRMIPRGPVLHQPAGRRRRDAARDVHPLYGPGLLPWTVGLAAPATHWGRSGTRSGQVPPTDHLSSASRRWPRSAGGSSEASARAAQSNPRPAKAEERQTCWRLTIIPPRNSIVLPPGSVPGGRPWKTILILNCASTEVFSICREVGSNHPVVVPLTRPP